MKNTKHMTLSIDNLVGLKVKTGSPGYENLETICEVSLTDVYSSDRFVICFESGAFTNMSETDMDLFLDEGEVHYTRRFTSQTDIAFETMSLAD